MGNLNNNKTLKQMATKDYTLLDLIQNHINEISKCDKEDFGIEYVASLLEESTGDISISVTATRGGMAHTRVLFSSKKKFIEQYDYASISEFLEYLRNSTL